VQPQAAQSVSHTLIGEPPKAARSPEELPHNFMNLKVVDARVHNVLRSAQDQAMHKGRFPPEGELPCTLRPILVA